MLDSDLKNQWVTARAAQANLPPFWGGARDRFPDAGLPNPDAGWAWVTGEPFAFSNFSPGEPNGGNNENCLEVNVTTGLWNDLTCSSPRSLICELP